MTPLDAVATGPPAPPRVPPEEWSRLHPPSRGPLATVRKYAKICRVSLVERMAYRGDFLLGTIFRFLPMVTTILLWRAIYAGAGRSELAGFRYREMIAYLLLTNISRMFSSM